MRYTFLLVALLSGLVHAQMYRWTDANGKVHYTDQKPTGNNDIKKLKAADTPADTKAAQTFAQKEMESRKKQKDANEAAGKSEKEKAEAAEKAENCSRAEADLKATESGQNRFTTGKDGERVALEGAVRDEELARLRKARDSWCKK